MRLYKFLHESINDIGLFKAVFLAGNPGAGKSYVLNKLSSGKISPRIINTDKFTEYYGKGAGVDWDLYGNKIESNTLEQVYHYINGMLPLWVDSTSSNPQNTVRRIGILSSFGYDVSCIWVNTSLETSLKRNAQRKRQVPEDFLKEVYNKSLQVKPFYRGKFDNFWEINNNEGELTNDIILKAFKSVTSFYSSPLKNPIGNTFIEEIQKSKGKYLEDLTFYKNKGFKSQITNWFK